MAAAASPVPEDALFEGAGEVRARFRQVDWAGSPLGPSAAWPAALRNTISLILGSRFPMFVAWGPQHHFFYNDAYAYLLTDRHPAALGEPLQQVWPELWPHVRPLIERTLQGESILGEDVRRTFRRADGVYESTFTLAYSPVRVDDGRVGGAYCAIFETTARLNIQRRREFQLELADSLRLLDSVREVTDTATAMLAGHMQLSRAEYREHLRLDRTVVLADAQADPAWSGEDARGLIAVPAGDQGGAGGHVLLAFDDKPRNWTTDEVALLQEVAERVRNAVDRARAEEQRAAAEERLREGMGAARMLIWEWELASGRASFSANAREILGTDVVQMSDIWQSLPEQDVERLKRAYADAIESSGSYQEVITYRRPDNGETIWLDVHGKVRRDAMGAPVAMRGVTVDVTARMRTQFGLQRAEARQSFQLNLTDRLRALSDTSRIFQTTTELVGRHLGVARVVCGNYDCEQQTLAFHSNYTDGSVAELLGTYPAAAFGSANFATLEAGATWTSADMRNDPRTGAPDVWPTFEQIDAHAAIVVPHTRHGALIACLIVASAEPRIWHPDDVALVEDAAGRMWAAIERVRAEEALMLADRRKDQFLAMLAHELRNPLAPISAAAELLRLPGVPPSRVSTTADIISRQVRHMTGLVDDLLDVSRVTSGLVGLELGSVDVRHVVADAVEQVRPLIEARRHRCTVETPSGAALVEGDYKRLVQVLANLLNNAAKYTPEEGTIKVTLETPGSQILLKVSDNGMGMAAGLLPHVFELFAQAERTPDRTQGGLGIGLALVRTLVELHGGTVSASSPGLGQGSEFVVRLPAATPDLDTDTDAGMQRSAAAAEAQRIMLVDDNVDGAQMLAMYLEACGHTVSVRHSAFEALALAQADTFDVFLLDIGLPGMDGNELARQLRATDAASDALLVAITGYGQESDKALAVEAGFDYFFVKPVEPAAIAEILSGGRRLP
ncbi:ATP-binding protein [Pseudoduganella sp. GCM10020061]|uniref:ATP-binding protein n=1 Tax=Pseudoduganella sp. GCM10020061 TaxID=3317345 RepID=UPI003628ADDA